MTIPVPVIPVRFTIAMAKTQFGNFAVVIKELNGFNDKVYIGTLSGAKYYYLNAISAVKGSGMWQTVGSHSSKEADYCIFEWQGEFSSIFIPEKGNGCV